MTEKQEKAEFIWATYVCSNPNCNDPGSPRGDRRCVEPSSWLKTDVIPEISPTPCPNCGSQLIRESSTGNSPSLP